VVAHLPWFTSELLSAAHAAVVVYHDGLTQGLLWPHDGYRCRRHGAGRRRSRGQPHGRWWGDGRTADTDETEPHADGPHRLPLSYVNVVD
jgi:hypothetical protein